MASLSDTELKARLIELGYPPGPITSSTRMIYLRRLEQLSTKKTSSSSSSEKPASHAPTQSRLVSRGAPEEPRPKTPPLAEGLPPAPPTIQHQSSVETTTKTGSGAEMVVSNFLRVLDDPSHPANDTGIVFGDGSVVFLSRAVLSSQCPKLTAFLYNFEEPFAVTVVTLTGRSSQFYVRRSEYVADLKERLALTQGIPVEEQRLVHSNNELVDTATIAESGVDYGATIHFVLITTVEPRLPPLALAGHSPWLSISHLKVELGLERFQRLNPVQVPNQTTTLPRHTAHILHIYDIPRDGFQLFVRLLYTGQTDSEGDLGCTVVAYILCVYFELSELAELCLSVIRQELNVATAIELLSYAVSVQCEPLKDLCASVINSK